MQSHIRRMHAYNHWARATFRPAVTPVTQWQVLEKVPDCCRAFFLLQVDSDEYVKKVLIVAGGFFSSSRLTITSTWKRSWLLWGCFFQVDNDKSVKKVLIVVGLFVFSGWQWRVCEEGPDSCGAGFVQVDNDKCMKKGPDCCGAVFFRLTMTSVWRRCCLVVWVESPRKTEGTKKKSGTKTGHAAPVAGRRKWVAAAYMLSTYIFLTGLFCF